MSELSDAEERLLAGRYLAEAHAREPDNARAIYFAKQDRISDLLIVGEAHLATIQRARLPITPERLKEAGFEESVHACGTKSLTKGRVSVMLLGECSFAVQFNNVFCHPQPQNMEDIARLSRNTNPSGGE